MSAVPVHPSDPNHRVVAKKSATAAEIDVESRRDDDPFSQTFSTPQKWVAGRHISRKNDDAVK